MTIQRSGYLVKFLKAFERIAPLKLADSSWDNVGLLYEAIYDQDFKGPFRILLTNDIVYSVYDEAKRKGINLILSYHPIWFKAEKRLNMELNSMTRMVTYCASSGISIFSPHTALDVMKGGMNDYIFSLLGIKDGYAIKMTEDGSQPNLGYGRIVKDLDLDLASGTRAIANNSNSNSNNVTTIKEILSVLKKALDLDYIRYALPNDKDLESKINSIAVCVGSGGSILLGSGANVYITGEMTHHDVIRATEIDKAIVILTEHSNCERPFLKNVLYNRLIEELKIEGDGLFEVMISESDRDPFRIYAEN